MKRRAIAIGVAVAAAMPFTGSLTFAPRDARADEACADVWLVKRDRSRWYPLGPDNCHETGMSRALHLWGEPTDTNLPGPFIGFGWDLWITGPA